MKGAISYLLVNETIRDLDLDLSVNVVDGQVRDIARASSSLHTRVNPFDWGSVRHMVRNIERTKLNNFIL